ncbi:MAG TPA: MmgE/PrpD family protein [Solirubrobacteraceae bacterium]|nr:MmgE/PrpD family protein [Solirubrobacteraceae bacterium]
MGTATAGLADALARWATELDPSEDDLALARRSLLDTVGVMVAAREDPLAPLFAQLPEAGRWAALAHVLDYDDLHLPSTTHISAVCLPVALASGGAERAYLAGAGVMARLGTALGWRHYSAGWHATCTAGAPAAAVTAAIAHGLDAEATARAIALAIPAAGGVQRAFGTAAKSLQIGFAAEAGVRAAALAGAGADADPLALEQWMALVGGDPEASWADTPAVPDGLAIKAFPCCYALQRPIAAVRELETSVPADGVRRIGVRTPAASLAPLIHHSPQTGLEGKFSLEYGIAAALLDSRPGFDSFSDAGVRRPDATRLMRAVEVAATDGGDHLLTGEVEIELETNAGAAVRTALALPPGAPERPMTPEELRAKLVLCGAGELTELSWESAAEFVRSL